MKDVITHDSEKQFDHFQIGERFLQLSPHIPHLFFREVILERVENFKTKHETNRRSCGLRLPLQNFEGIRYAPTYPKIVWEMRDLFRNVVIAAYFERGCHDNIISNEFHR